MLLNDYECFVNTLCANDRVELDWIEYNSDLAEIFVKRYGVIGQISTQGWLLKKRRESASGMLIFRSEVNTLFIKIQERIFFFWP